MKISYTNLLVSSIFSINWNQSKKIVDANLVRIDYLPFANVRLDPIINQGCLSDHVHTFYGAQTLFPNLTHADLVNTPATNSSATVEENKSIYWHPSVYAYDSETDTYKLDTMDLTTTYYLWDFGKDTMAFPNGFRMIGGYDKKSTREGWSCADEKPCNKQDCSAPSGWKFPTTRCSELEMSMIFPNCWDGVNLDSDDHMQHVAYSLAEETEDLPGAPCPETHPVRLPLINFFVRILNYDGGLHTFSDGSDIFHADYVSGWDDKHLQSMLDNCEETNDFVTTEEGGFCEEWLTYRLRPDLEAESQFIKDLQNIQPPNALDTTYLTNEAVNNVVKLPRGECEGELLWDGTRNATYLANDDECCCCGDAPRGRWRVSRSWRGCTAVGGDGVIDGEVVVAVRTTPPRRGGVGAGADCSPPPPPGSACASRARLARPTDQRRPRPCSDAAPRRRSQPHVSRRFSFFLLTVDKV